MPHYYNLMAVSCSVVTVSGCMALPFLPFAEDIHHLQSLAVMRSSLSIRQRILLSLVSVMLTISLRTTELS